MNVERKICFLRLAQASERERGREKDLVESRAGCRGRGPLVELGETGAASSLRAVNIALGVGHHVVLQRSEIESREAEDVILLELGLLLLTITLRRTGARSDVNIFTYLNVLLKDGGCLCGMTACKRDAATVVRQHG